jgi:hypothetical protein
LLWPDPKLVELTHRVRLQVDADSERLQIAHGFEHDTRHADLVQGQRDCQTSNAAPGNEDRSMIHRPLRISFLFPWNYGISNTS